MILRYQICTIVYVNQKVQNCHKAYFETASDKVKLQATRRTYALKILNDGDDDDDDDT